VLSTFPLYFRILYFVNLVMITRMILYVEVYVVSFVSI
jgi:hypothetical protein